MKVPPGAEQHVVLLSQTLREHPSAEVDVSQLRGLLRDAVQESDFVVVSVLVAAAEQGVATELRLLATDAAIRGSRSMAERLTSQRGLTSSWSLWAVAVWFEVIHREAFPDVESSGGGTQPNSHDPVEQTPRPSPSEPHDSQSGEQLARKNRWSASTWVLMALFGTLLILLAGQLARQADAAEQDRQELQVAAEQGERDAAAIRSLKGSVSNRNRQLTALGEERDSLARQLDDRHSEIQEMHDLLSEYEVQLQRTQEARVESFYRDVVAAFERSDWDWLVERRHPNQREHWTPEVCRTAMESWDPNQFAGWTLVRVFKATETSVDYSDGRSVSIGDGYKVEFVNGVGESWLVTVSLDSGGPFWFGSCGT